MTSKSDYNTEYLLDSDEEPLRLERQARIYGFEDDLRHLALRLTDRVLDAGCGSGSITRAIASHVPQCSATGLDREPKHVDFARRKAAAEGIGNIHFEVGDVLKLPFGARSFDVAWSKHLLQWVKDREQALGELKRVGAASWPAISTTSASVTTLRIPSYRPKQKRSLTPWGGNWDSIICWAGSCLTSSCELASRT